MSYVFGAVAAFAVLAFGTKTKNTIEDTVTANSDSFTAHDPLFQSNAAVYGVDWRMVKAICMNESSLGEARSVKRGLENPNDVEGSKSFDGKSWGPMQVTIPTGRDFDPACSPQLLNNWGYSVDLACQFLSSLQSQFPIGPYGSRAEEWIVKSYNQGAGNTRKEIDGKIAGYAQEYWERYTRNRALIKSKQGV